jgi:predicted O-methyltransferase YrrM
MTNSLQRPAVRNLLDRLFLDAEEDDQVIAELGARHPDHREGVSAQERSDVLQDVYMPISPEGGQLLYALVRACCPTTVVEFGMSYGISTIHLAAAVRDNGVGRVVTTEFSSAKVARARANFLEAGLEDVVTVLEGDARETLAGLKGPVELVLLDGWKNLCLEVLRLLEPRLTPGALVLADDVSAFPERMAEYLTYVRDPMNGYVSITFPVADGIEVSCRS